MHALTPLKIREGGGLYSCPVKQVRSGGDLTRNPVQIASFRLSPIPCALFISFISTVVVPADNELNPPFGTCSSSYRIQCVTSFICCKVYLARGPGRNDTLSERGIKLRPSHSLVDMKRSLNPKIIYTSYRSFV
jgi:hypothetical protein